MSNVESMKKIAFEILKVLYINWNNEDECSEEFHSKLKDYVVASESYKAIGLIGRTELAYKENEWKKERK